MIVGCPLSWTQASIFCNRMIVLAAKTSVFVAVISRLWEKSWCARKRSLANMRQRVPVMSCHIASASLVSPSHRGEAKLRCARNFVVPKIRIAIAMFGVML